MCGIVAHISWNEGGRIPDAAFVAMLSELALRGPDDASVLHRQGVTLGHRRLSIIDVVGGSQPVFNEGRTVACILNGEIYNFRELRARLEKAGHHFRTNSDTEAIVHLYEEVGDQVFANLTGMFTIVLADFARSRTLVARDRLGEKPLYYVDKPGFFTCGSELKVFRHHPQVQCVINRAALARFLRFGWIPGSESIFQGIHRLEPAHYLAIENCVVHKHRYWHPDLTPLKADRTEMCEMLVAELDRTIKNKLIADVPLGAFLSGGLDSSTIVAMAARHGTRLKTLSVGFGTQVNELPYARLVAERYNTEHIELIVDANIPEAIEKVSDYFDEPFADSSSVPTYLISKAAREHVKVILTGDGGDELLAGYEAYTRLRAYSGNRVLSKAARLADAGVGLMSGFSLLDRIYPLPDSANAGLHWRDLRSAFNSRELGGLLGEASVGDTDALGAPCFPLAGTDPLTRSFEFDLSYYLPDDLLKKVDMASMANSLECRAPLLDHHLVELCMRIPPIEKVRGGRDKGVLRDAMRPYLPETIVRREKHGFGAPLAHWLSNHLKDAVSELVSPTARIADVADMAQVRECVTRSLGQLHEDWRAPLRVWVLLMLEQWLRRQQVSSQPRAT
jgi:asparagine synthase (glutamine-hydrolysing)